jgi:peptide/nickel transport system ATP-binding protein
MYKGKIVEENDTNAIFQNPQHPYTKGLIACKPSMDTRLKVLPIINDFLSNKDISYEIEDINQRKQKQAYIYSTEPIIKVRDLELNFIIKKSWTGKILKSYSALKKISFDVYENEVLGLVGESGCGKTTLGRTLLKLLDPTGGEIYYNNIPAIKMTKEQMKDFRKNFQIIFQDPYSSLNPYLTIGSTIIEPMIVHNILENDKQRKEKVIYLLERVGLKADYYYRYPHEFSGGQRQRICIARTLSMSPKFIICDESVSALDVSVQAQVLNLLNELKQDFNFTYIFISHDLSVVKFMSDRIIVMNQGKIEEADFADEIYLHPKTEYTKKLISAIPHIKLDKNNKY